MANIVYYEPINGGDQGVWGPKELRQNRLAQGVNSCLLYDDSGALKITTGQFGIVTPTKYAKVEIDTVTTIPIAGLTVSLWAKIECSISGSTPSIVATSIAGANDPETVPTEFTGAFVGAKGGYYLDTSKRCLGLAWIDSGGALDGIINPLPGIDGYAGSSDSNANNFCVLASEDQRGNYAFRNKGATIEWDDTNSQFSMSHKAKILIPTLHMQDQKNSGTVGGAGTAGSRQTRTLNTEVYNSIAGASLDAGTSVFTLPAGTYEVEAYSCYSRTDDTRTWILNITGAADLAKSLNNRFTAANLVRGHSIIPKTIFTIVGTITARLEYHIQTNTDTNNLGYPSSIDTEIYASVTVRQIA